MASYFLEYGNGTGKNLESIQFGCETYVSHLVLGRMFSISEANVRSISGPILVLGGTFFGISGFWLSLNGDPGLNNNHYSLKLESIKG